MTVLKPFTCCALWGHDAGARKSTSVWLRDPTTNKLREISVEARVNMPEIEMVILALKHPRTPWAARLFLGAAVAYALSPIDLIPDFIPVLGHLDDLIVVPLLVAIGLQLIPDEVIQDCRKQAGLAARD